MKFNKIALLTTLTSFCVASHASSPDAWTEHFNTVNDVCVKASELKDAKSVGKVIVFDDSVGFDALLIQGTVNKQAQIKLCLFNKKTQTANIADADDLLAKE